MHVRRCRDCARHDAAHAEKRRGTESISATTGKLRRCAKGSDFPPRFNTFEAYQHGDVQRALQAGIGGGMS